MRLFAERSGKVLFRTVQSLSGSGGDGVGLLRVTLFPSLATTCAVSRSRVAPFSDPLAQTPSRVVGVSGGGVGGFLVGGGGGPVAAARRLTDAGLNIVGVPKTIDNDLAATD